MNLEYFAGKLAKSYQEERLKEAQTERLLKEIRAGRPALLARLRVYTGNFLIATGWCQNGNLSEEAFDSRSGLKPCPEGQPCV